MALKTLALIAVIGGVLASSEEKFFRHDYIFHEEYNTFYKLHWTDNSKTWDDAFITCDYEGAKLFYPGDQYEWAVAANLTELLTEVDEIFVGVRDENGMGNFVSIDGRLVPEFSDYATNREGDSKCVVMSARTGVYSLGSCKHRRPFICKKVNESCPTVDSAYIYSPIAKKCYKVNSRPRTWSDALNTCLMEGGILASPTEVIESSLLHKLLETHKLYFIGVRRILPEGAFYTLQGSMFELYTGRSNEEENCKVLILYPATNDYNSNRKFDIDSNNCNTTLAFICEMHV